MANKIGIRGKLYRNTGSYEAPTWTEINLARDVQMAMPWDLEEASARLSRVKTYSPTQLDLTPTVTVRNDTANAGYLALRSSSLTGTAIDLLILDAPISEAGSFGIRAEFHVSATGQDQSISAVIYDNFDLRPATTSNAPKVATVSSPNVVTFTDFGA
jgi:hypothetical protein